MSAYLSRIIDRFSPTRGDDKRTSVEPFVRSHSPVAGFDQRPGLDDSLGFESLEPHDSLAQTPEPAAPITGPRPARVQRKELASPIAPAVSSINAAPAPGHGASPARGPAPALNRGSASPNHAAIAPAPRREPMDPPSLFDPFPRFFDAGEVSPSPAGPEFETSSDARSPLTPSPATFSPAARQTQPASSPLQPPPPPAVGLERRALQSEAKLPAPWRYFDPSAPEAEPATAPFLVPSRPLLEPAPEAESDLSTAMERSVVALYHAVPRPPAAAAYVPDPGPVPSAELSAASRPRVHIGRVEIEVVPSPASARASASQAPAQRPSIDTISQIGPLARHFPNRRLLRLRYR